MNTTCLYVEPYSCNVNLDIFQQIDGEAFLLLTQADIVNIMELKLGPALKIYNSILLFRQSLES